MNGIGDINSNKIGTAARYNSGKPDISLIPLSIIANDIKSSSKFVEEVKQDIDLVALLKFVDDFQFNGNISSLYLAIQACSSAWTECADVFTYGKIKYASWNWLKGMNWSVPVACIGRHALKISKGELIDEESKISHRGHIMCNLVMLIQYVETYPEGNDLPQNLFEK